jgi:glycosyltransferase involved in cell wall biosynthesis
MRMKKGIVSVFTPTNDSHWLPEIYRCLLEQTDQNWEWVVVYNNGAEPLDLLKSDKRIKTHYVYNAPKWVGPLKRAACELADGEYLLELDHDDLLTRDAIAEVRRAFDDPEVGFVYSNNVHCSIDFEAREKFDPRFGWKYRDFDFRGHALHECVHFEPSPAVVSRIWFAPDHLRAFHRTAYDAAGGYSADMRILDDQDLMSRMYCVTRFHHIDKPLYIYRVHGENTWLKYNEEIQQNVLRIYDERIEGMAEKWSRDKGLRLIEVGGRMNAKDGFETVDLRDADITADLEQRWPFEDNSVGCLRSFDVFEHLRNPVHTMSELHRVLAPEAYAFIQVPSTDGRGAFQDPTHVSFWNENSFAYYTDQRKNKYIDCDVRFQALRLYTTQRSEDQVCWTVAHLMKLGDGRVPGEVLI